MTFNDTGFDVSNLLNIAFKAKDKQGLCVMRLENNIVMLTWSDGSEPLDASTWNEIVRPKNENSVPKSNFEGGYVGWLSYEAGEQFEMMPQAKNDHNDPTIKFWKCSGAILIDERKNSMSVVGDSVFRTEAARILAMPTPAPSQAYINDIYSQTTEQEFISGIKEILLNIKEGNVYQVNLSWAYTLGISAPLSIFSSLIRENPSLYAGYLNYDDTGVISNSPELFLRLRRDKTNTYIESTPIKGTAFNTDTQSRLQLWSSEKERAELSMIVDMVRNDFGRIALPGTVQTDHRRIRRCGDLFHAEQTVRAQIPNTLNIVDVLRATFPPASVTGAPKVSAMKQIGALEKTDRGIYTGCIGYIGYDGQAQFSVAIRCLPFHKQHARLHIGAGIVADSSPSNEWLETHAKARAILKILSSPP